MQQLSLSHLERLNVTRFGEISPLWQKSLRVFGHFLPVYFSFGKMLSLLWQICDIHSLKWPNNEKDYNNLVTLERLDRAATKYKNDERLPRYVCNEARGF